MKLLECMGRRRDRGGWVLAAIIFSLAVIMPAAAESTLIRVEGGMIQGVATNDLLVFKGIPFAQPPVGALRWRPPQPVKSWAGIHDASVFSPDPMQPLASSRAASRISEDCLYLNVWRPAVVTGGKPLPVMVWIYGGGLVLGGASVYDLSSFAHQGIVAVSFNYRVGRLGFFAHPALAREAPDDLRGNYGYMDQIAALEWVRRNIAAFGGDPRKVTIAGESAGGGSVLALLTSPLARGLFARAILESPGIPSARADAGPMRSLASAESIALEYARAAGITGDGPAALEALRAIPAEKLVAGNDNYVLAIFGGPEIPGLAYSMIDGRLVVEAPEATLRAGRQAMVPVMVGANDYDLAAGPAQTKDALFAQFGYLSAPARKLYDPSGDKGFQELFQSIMADEDMIEPSRYLAEMTARAGQPAYFYRFAYVPEVLRPKLAGATHALEMLFALDGFGIFPWIKPGETDKAMARTMNGYWAAFVKTGDPNGGGRPVWPPYNPATREVLNFTAAGVANGPDPLKERLDLWEAVWGR